MKKTVVVCLIKNGKKQIRTCSTMTDDLLALSDWLASEGTGEVMSSHPPNTTRINAAE